MTTTIGAYYQVLRDRATLGELGPRAAPQGSLPEAAAAAASTAAAAAAAAAVEAGEEATCAAQAAAVRGEAREAALNNEVRGLREQLQAALAAATAGRAAAAASAAVAVAAEAASAEHEELVALRREVAELRLALQRARPGSFPGPSDPRVPAPSPGGGGVGGGGGGCGGPSAARPLERATPGGDAPLPPLERTRRRRVPSGGLSGGGGGGSASSAGRASAAAALMRPPAHAPGQPPAAAAAAAAPVASAAVELRTQAPPPMGAPGRGRPGSGPEKHDSPAASGSPAPYQGFAPTGPDFSLRASGERPFGRTIRVAARSPGKPQLQKNGPVQSPSPPPLPPRSRTNPRAGGTAV